MPAQRRHWLGIRVLDGRSPRTRCRRAWCWPAAAGRAGRARVRADGSYAAASDPRVLFGLGRRRRAGRCACSGPTGGRGVRRTRRRSLLGARVGQGAAGDPMTHPITSCLVAMFVARVLLFGPAGAGGVEAGLQPRPGGLKVRLYHQHRQRKTRPTRLFPIPDSMRSKRRWRSSSFRRSAISRPPSGPAPGPGNSPMRTGSLGHLYTPTSSPTPLRRRTSAPSALRPAWRDGRTCSGICISRRAGSRKLPRFVAARRASPADRAATVRLGQVYLGLNQLRNAREQFDEAAAVFPALAQHGLGDVALRERRFADAVTHFRSALDRVPQATSIHYQLAMAYRGLGRLDEARSHLRLRRPGRDPDRRSDRGRPPGGCPGRTRPGDPGPARVRRRTVPGGGRRVRQSCRRRARERRRACQPRAGAVPTRPVRGRRVAVRGGGRASTPTTPLPTPDSA